jgi:hypothetical protein
MSTCATTTSHAHAAHATTTSHTHTHTTTSKRPLPHATIATTTKLVVTTPSTQEVTLRGT